MDNIRICWRIGGRLEAAGHAEYGRSEWRRDTPARRRFFEAMVSVGDAEHGDGSHWLEQRPAAASPP